MSHDAVDVAMHDKPWESRGVNLTIAETAVLIVLAHHHNPKTGRCNPGQERIARSAGMTRRCAQRALASLQAYGIIATKARGNGRGHSTRYLLTFIEQSPKGEPSTPFTGADSPTKGEPSTPFTGADTAVKGEQHDTKGRTEDARTCRTSSRAAKAGSSPPPLSAQRVKDDAAALFAAGLVSEVPTPGSLPWEFLASLDAEAVETLLVWAKDEPERAEEHVQWQFREFEEARR